MGGRGRGRKESPQKEILLKDGGGGKKTRDPKNDAHRQNGEVMEAVEMYTQGTQAGSEAVGVTNLSCATSFYFTYHSHCHQPDSEIFGSRFWVSLLFVPQTAPCPGPGMRQYAR